MDGVIGALDVGGTKILAALIAPDGRVLGQTQAPSLAPRGPLDAVERIVAAFDGLLNGAGLERSSMRALGCSIPGPIDRAQGIVVFSPNLKWYDFALRTALQQRLPVPVEMDDDANCAALGEGWRGAAQGYRHFLYVTVSTGVGAGLVLDGRVYHGAHDGAGEIGHTVVEPGGPPCSCGNAGCLEALCSGTAIAARARDALLHGQETVLREMAGSDPAALRCETVFAAAAAGDPCAREILRAAGTYLGIGLANLATIFDPEAIVVGGGVMMGGAAIVEPALAAFRRRALPPVRRTPILQATLGPLSALWGAARLVLAEG